MKKQIGIIGLGKMGLNIALNLKDKNWDVVAYNRSPQKLEHARTLGVSTANTIQELVLKLEAPRVIWIMLTAGEPTNNIIDELSKSLSPDDIVIDGGNSQFNDDIRNSHKLQSVGIGFVDVGVSGGPEGARNGACLMIGGDQKNYTYLIELYESLSLNKSYEYFEGIGAGHYVKMIHNGIEYGMMQAIAEGFTLLKSSEYGFDLSKVANIYNKESVIESKLIKLLIKGYTVFGNELNEVSGKVEYNGEGHWTVEEAKSKSINVPVIENAVKFRDESHSTPSYTGKILTMLRHLFGGHSIN